MGKEGRVPDLQHTLNDRLLLLECTKGQSHAPFIYDGAESWCLGK